MFIIQGDWAEVRGICPLTLNVPLGHWVLHRWTSSILSWGDALLPLVGCTITGTAFCYSISLVWVSSVAQSCLTLCDPTDCSTPAFSIHHQLPEYTQTHVYCESVMPSNHLIFCRSLRLLPSIFPSIRVFPNELILRIRRPKYWSFNFSISPSSEYSGLISFRIDMLGLLADQGTLKSLLQHHSSKTSILWHSAFFTVQLSHPYMCTGKKQSFD